MYQNGLNKYRDEKRSIEIQAFTINNKSVPIPGNIHFGSFHGIDVHIDRYLTATVIYTGNSSMHIAINVQAGNPRRKDRVKTTHCVMVFAAVDDNGKTIPVPKWTPDTPAAIEMENYAQKLMALRQNIEDEMKPYM